MAAKENNFAGKRQKINSRISRNLPGFDKNTASYWGNIVNKVIRDEIHEVEGNEVCSVINRYARENVIGVKFDKEQAKIIAKRKTDRKNQAHIARWGTSYTPKELAKFEKDIITELRANVTVVNAEEQYKRYAVYIWQIMSRTPVDENYYKRYRKMKSRDVKVKSEFSRFWNYTKSERYETERIEYHEADDLSLRDCWRFQFGSAKRSIVLTPQEMSMIDFDMPLSEDHIKIISTIVKMKFGKPVPIVSFTISLVGGEETHGKYQAIEFGRYGLNNGGTKRSTSDWQQIGGKIQHGTRAGYSVQAPFGIATLAQIEQEVMDEIMGPKLEEIRGKYVKKLGAAFDEVAHFLNAFKSQKMFVDKVMLDADTEIHKQLVEMGIGYYQNENTDVKYQADIDIIKTMYRGEFSEAMQEKLKKELHEENGRYTYRAGIDFKQYKKDLVKMSAKVRREEEGRRTARARLDQDKRKALEEKRRRREERKLIEESTEEIKTTSNEDLNAFLAKFEHDAESSAIDFSKAVRSLNRGWDDRQYNVFVSLAEIDPLLKKNLKQIEDFKTEIKALKKTGEESKAKIKERMDLYVNLWEQDIIESKKYGTFENEDQEELNNYIKDCKRRISIIDDRIKAIEYRLRRLYDFNAKYLDLIMNEYKALATSDKEIMEFDIQHYSNNVVIDFLGDVYKAHNNAVVAGKGMNVDGIYEDINVKIFANDVKNEWEKYRKEVKYNQNSLKNLQSKIDDFNKKEGRSNRYSVNSSREIVHQDKNVKANSSYQNQDSVIDGKTYFLPYGWAWENGEPPKKMSDLIITKDGIKANYDSRKGKFRYFEDGKGIIWIED